jgi:histidinol-phosphate aminotransferase
MRGRFVRKASWVASRIVQRFGKIHSLVTKPDEVDVALAAVARETSKTDLSNQVVVITGSTRGVGLAVAQAFSRAGANVVLNGRSKETLESAVREIRGSGGDAIGIDADISQEVGARKLIDETVRSRGRLDILINNAAVLGPVRRNLWEIGLKEWQETLDVNLTGSFLCTRFAVDWMRKNGVAGRIVNVSTGAARSSGDGLTPYAISKAALESLTRNVAAETGWAGPAVVGIELGSLQTQMARKYYSWEDFQLLPPPETAIPVFLYAATAPPERVHGRILAAWRYGKDPEAEAVLNGPVAEMERFSFLPIRKDGEVVSRFDPGIVALDRAENPFGMPGKVRALLAHAEERFDFARYPNEEYPSLRKILGEKTGIPEDCFTFGNGSCELVERAVRTFAQPGDEVLANDPTWFMFDRYCQSMGVMIRKIPFLDAGGRFDHNLDGIRKAIQVKTRLIYLVNPSNPLGAGIRKEEFLRFLEHVPPHIPIIVDEAYLEFSSRPETLRSHEVIPRTDRRVIGLRTFSKFYALASLRIGYGFSGRETMRLFNRLEPLFALSSLSEAAAVAALSDEEHFSKTFDNITKERSRIEARLTAAGLGYYHSESNFMLVESPVSPEKTYAAFEAEGVIIPRGSYKNRFVFLPIVDPAKNERNLQILVSLR